MKDVKAHEPGAIVERIRAQIAGDAVPITTHAHAEMVQEGIALDEVVQTLRTGHVLENYPEHRRGACCLVGGNSDAGRPLQSSAQPKTLF